MKYRKRTRVTLDERARYRVVFAGCIEAVAMNWGATVEIAPSCDESCETTIVTGIFDQAALHGLLRSAYARGFPLISVKRVPPPSGESATTAPTGENES